MMKVHGVPLDTQGLHHTVRCFFCAWNMKCLMLKNIIFNSADDDFICLTHSNLQEESNWCCYWSLNMWNCIGSISAHDPKQPLITQFDPYINVKPNTGEIFSFISLQYGCKCCKNINIKVGQLCLVLWLVLTLSLSHTFLQSLNLPQLYHHLLAISELRRRATTYQRAGDGVAVWGSIHATVREKHLRERFTEGLQERPCCQEKCL